MIHLKCFYIKIWSFLWCHFFNTKWKQLIDKKCINKIYNYLNARAFKKIYLRINDYSEEDLLAKYKIEEEKFFSKFSKVKNWETVYIYALYWAAWDYACAFIYIKDIVTYLKKKKCRIILIWNKKLKDILKLCNIYWNIKIEYTKFYIYWINESCARILLKWDVNIKNETLICINSPSNFDLFLKDPEKYWWIKVNYELGKSFQRKFHVENTNTICNKSSYVYDNVDKSKINNILKNYSNEDWLIICNFENKSFRVYKHDGIEFSKYIENLKFLWSRYNLKFVVNSVYNHEKLYKDNNVLITRLNFQEIIYLAENNKIHLFISERNWLNDIFYVFYPKIDQIIYYPDCYYVWVCIDKNLFEDIYMQNLRIDTLNAHYLFWRDNVIQKYRKDYFNTIENNLQNFL